MEKQTIGQFLSALRRSNGYTQQEVAEKLGVSNKTVSCWERDSSYPDISMIPAIAELYGVTCDEILRAKRAPAQPAEPPENGAEAEKAKANAEKAEKEASAIFDNMLARYDNTHKIATAAALFASLFSVFAAVATISLSNYLAAAFFIVIPVTGISLFAYALISYRVNFAVPDEPRAYKVKRAIYIRRKCTVNLILPVLLYFIPYCFNFERDTRYIAWGLFLAALYLLAAIAFNPVSRLYHSKYYPALDRDLTKAKATARIAVLSLAIFASAVFAFTVRQIPLSDVSSTGGGQTVAEGIDELETLLGHSYLPDTYTPANVIPSISDQYAEYSYNVKRTDFDEDDVNGYLAYGVSGGMLDDTYRVNILYPVWHVTYNEYNPLTDKTETKTKKIIVYNVKYQTAFLSNRGDDKYLLYYFDYNSLVRRKNDRDFDYTVKFAVAVAVVTLALYALSGAIINERDKIRRRKNAESGQNGDKTK